MNIIKPSWQIIEPTGYTRDDIYKSIELAGRVSHKSEDKITKDSAKVFVGRMLNMKHLATCEFGTVYLYIKGVDKTDITKYLFNKYSKVVEGSLDHFYVTSNYRVLVENNWLDDLQYLCEPTEYHHKRYTVKFICDRGILAEFTRHRTFSFMAESSRYCNYSKDKFGNEITFIQPCWNYLKTAIYSGIDNFDGDYFEHSLREAEIYYFKLLEQGWKPEQARAVLPNALKTELYMCGYAEDWEKFFELRDDKQHVHPQAYELAHPLHEEFIKRGYINE